MKKLLITAAISIPAVLQAQNAITSDIVEGGKTLIELIKVIKGPRMINAVQIQQVSPLDSQPDSCGIKKVADISFKNKTGKPVQVSMYFRTGNMYEKNPFSLTLSAFSQESLYELKAGIYKYKIESGEEDYACTLHEGELKLLPCEKLIREIK